MPNRILVPLIVACALFMENLDSTVLSTSLPAIAADFGEDPIHLKLALTSYLLSLAVFIPASRLAGRPVRRAAGLPAGDRRLHHRLDPVRPVGVDRRAGRRPHRAGHRRRDDGAGRPAGDPAHRAEARARRLARLADRPGADRPGHRAAARRLHHHLFRTGAGSSGSTCRSASSASCWRRSTSRTSAARSATPFDTLGFVLSAVGLAALMTGSTTLGPRPAAAAGGRSRFLGGAALICSALCRCMPARTAAPILDLTLLRIPTFRASAHRRLAVPHRHRRDARSCCRCCCSSASA